MGRPIVLLSGTAGSYLIRTSNLHGGNADYTVVALNVRPTASTDNHAVIGQHFGTNDYSGSDEDINIRYNGGILRMQVTAYTAYSGASAQGSTALTEDAIVRCMALRRSSTTVDAFLNTAIEATVTHDAAGAGRTAMADFGIGGGVYGAGETVDIGTVIVYERALSDAEIASIQVLGRPRDARNLHCYVPNYPGAHGKEWSGRGTGRDFTVVNSPAAGADGTGQGGRVAPRVRYGRPPSSGTNTTVTPTTASLTLTTFAPTVSVSNNQLVTPTTASLTTTTFAPVLGLGIIPGTASLTLTGFAPTVTASDNQTVTPTTASLTLTTFAPTVTTTGNQIVTPTTASLTLTGFAPVLDLAITPSTTALVLTTFAPTVTASTGTVYVTPTTAALVLTTYAPTVTTTTPIAITTCGTLSVPVTLAPCDEWYIELTGPSADAPRARVVLRATN